MRKLHTYIALLLMMFISIGYAFGQKVGDRVIRGVVYDGSKANVLPGVAILLLNDNNRIMHGVTTDLDGKFEVTCPKGIKRVSFQFLGYKTQTLSLQFEKAYQIILKEDVMSLDEVVVTGKTNRQDMGMLQRNKRDVVSAVSSVDMSMVEHQGVASVEQLLQGAVPGMQVIFNSGDPGAGASVKIRGSSSLTGSSAPLWIIDGAEVIGDDYNVESITNFGFSPIGDIDPSQIESIDILKDAASTAIYGSRGANGVIVIRTKRGTRGKPQFSFSTKQNITRTPRKIPMLSGDEQRIFLIESLANKNGGDTGDFLMPLRGDLSRDDAWMYNNNTDWVDEITRLGYQQDYNFSLRGGGERLNYYWGVAYTNEYGTTVGGGYDRFSTSLNLDYKMSDKLKIATKFSYINSMTDKRSSAHPIERVKNEKINPISYARARASYFPVYNENGTDYHIERNNREETSWTSQYNPLAIIDYSSFLTRANRFTSSISLNFQLNKKIDLYSQVSVDYRQSGDDYFMPPHAIGTVAGEAHYNYGNRTDGYQMKIVNNNRMTYRPLMNDKHYLAVTGIFDVIYDMSNSVGIAYSNGASPELREADASARIANIYGGKGESAMMSIVANAHYKFKNRYNVDMSLKTEASSKYGEDNPYSIYPTVGLSWDMKREWFFADKEWVGMIKPRFAFGRSGRLPNVNNILQVAYGTGSNGYLGSTYTYIDKFAYDNIHEERSSDFNYGLDWALFNNRISGELNYYSRKTTDLLLKESMASTSGFSERWVNFGSLTNKGWELGVNVTPIQNLDNRFKWSFYFNISRNRSKLVELPKNIKEDDYIQEMEGFKSKLQVGDVIGGFYGYRALGVYSKDADAIARDFKGNPIYDLNGDPKYLRYGDQNGHTFRGGDMIYEDVNRDGLINELDMVQIGDANPDYYGMFRNSLNWRQWSLNVSFYYNLGNDLVNGMRRQTEGMIGQENQAASVINRWRTQGDVTDMPRAERDATWNTVSSTRWVEDGSYVKLKELTVSYQLPQSLLKRMRFRNGSISLTGMNLFTWTKYKGVDPEIGTGGGITIFGVDKQNTAPPMRFTFGMNLSF